MTTKNVDDEEEFPLPGSEDLPIQQLSLLVRLLYCPIIEIYIAKI